VDGEAATVGCDGHAAALDNSSDCVSSSANAVTVVDPLGGGEQQQGVLYCNKGKGLLGDPLGKQITLQSHFTEGV